MNIPTDDKSIKESNFFRSVSRGQLEKIALSKNKGIVDVNYEIKVNFIKKKNPCFVTIKPESNF